MKEKDMIKRIINTYSKEEVDVLTRADSITFADGETFQDKLDSGVLKGDSGELIRVGNEYETAQQVKLFFKLVD